MKKYTSPRFHFILGMSILLSPGVTINARTLPAGDSGEQVQLTTASQIQAYPNPFNQVLNVSVPTAVGHSVTIDLLPLAGGPSVLNRTVNMTVNAIQLNTTAVPRGQYNLTIRDVNGLVGTKRLSCTH